MTARPLLVVDGDSFAHRAFHALPRSMRRENGSPGNALEANVPLVPAAVKGTDRLLRLGPLRVRYGAEVELDDLRALEPHAAAQQATERLMARIEELEAEL